MLEEMKLKDILELVRCLNGKKESCSYHDRNGEEIRIVILQRGWVQVGRFYRVGDECILKDGYTIRRWGTSEGLGELAFKGPLPETILDKIPESKFHCLTVVASFLCDEKKWAEYVK